MDDNDVPTTDLVTWAHVGYQSLANNYSRARVKPDVMLVLVALAVATEAQMRGQSIDVVLNDVRKMALAFHPADSASASATAATKAPSGKPGPGS